MVIQKASGPNALSLEELVDEFDASRASIYRWLKEAAPTISEPAEPKWDSGEIIPICSLALS